LKTAGVVAFAFGVPSSIRSNRLIALIASKRARELDCRVYTQFDVNILPGIETTYINQQDNNPPTTLRIARGAVQWAVIHRLTELWIVAAKPCLDRALRDVQQTIREIEAEIKVYVCAEINQYSEDSWFCMDSSQPRVRSRKEWRKRERILKLMPFFLYKRIAN